MVNIFIKRYLPILITLLIFIVLVSWMDIARTWQSILHADGRYLLLSLLAALLFPFLSGLRWHLIVFQLGKHLGIWESYKLIMAAWPLGTITPAKSGDLIKILFLRHFLPYSKTTGVILAERVMDVTALCVFSLIGGLIYGFIHAIWVSGGILCGVLLFLLFSNTRWVELLPPKWHSIADNVLEATVSMVLHWRSFLLIFMVTLLNWFMTFVQTWLCYCAFHVEVPFLYMFAALPIAIFIGLAPITIAGMGTRDGAIIWLFGKYATLETNVLVGLLYSFFGYWILAFLGIPFMRAAFQGAIGSVSKEELEESIGRKERYKLEN